MTDYPLAFSGGQLTGAGKVKPGSGATAGVTSTATVAPAAKGVPTIQGHFTQLLPGTMNFELGVTAQHPSAIVCWPAEFVGRTLYWNTNLNATHWTLLPGVTNR